MFMSFSLDQLSVACCWLCSPVHAAVSVDAEAISGMQIDLPLGS
jgi:hypothetical protein